MKKLAIGCGVVLVVLLIVGAAASYFVYNKVKSTVAELSVLGEIPTIERGVRNTAAFTAPESGELTEAQVARYLKVQQDVRTVLGSRLDEFKTRYAELSARLDKDKGSVLDVPAMMGAYRDLAKTYVDAKKAQVDALNSAGFSLDEYRWVRQQAYAAIGMPIVDMDFAKVIEDATSGRSPETPGGPPLGGSVEPTGPEFNKTLVAPHKKQLEDNAALSYFGL
jgi:hypothetical protein